MGALITWLSARYRFMNRERFFARQAVQDALQVELDRAAANERARHDDNSLGSLLGLFFFNCLG